MVVVRVVVAVAVRMVVVVDNCAHGYFLQLDFGGLDVARLVPPGTADVGQNRGNLGVGELLERLHGGIGATVQHGIDGLLLGAGRPCCRQARGLHRLEPLPGRLVTRDAVRRVDLLAAAHELRHGKRLGVIRARRRGRRRCARRHFRGSLGLVLRHPLGVLVRLHRADHDRHVPMLLAAKLGALAAERALLLGAKPCVAQETRNRVLLCAKSGDPPGMDDVGGGRNDADLLADRHHHLVVDFEQVVLALGRRALDLLARRGERGHEADALALAAQIVVAPLPLVAGDLDRHVRSRGVLLRDNHLGHRPGDDYEHDRRDDRPEKLDGGVLVELRGLVADRFRCAKQA